MRCGNRLARCHVTGQDCSRLTPLLWLQISSRLVLCVHFASELVDKFANWDEWVTVIQNAGFPGPTYMLCLVVGLLMVGTPMLAGGVFLRWAAGLLLLFQIPTTAFFETGDWYEQADSISVMGGLLLAVTVDELQREFRAVHEGRPASDCSSCCKNRPSTRTLATDDGLDDEENEHGEGGHGDGRRGRGSRRRGAAASGSSSGSSSSNSDRDQPLLDPVAEELEAREWVKPVGRSGSRQDRVLSAHEGEVIV
jgi:uncharacterized membrane protein YphA (DoxX/SURF4 family)